jgi:predicted alpha/beta superfamily hydrolase
VPLAFWVFKVISTGHTGDFSMVKHQTIWRLLVIVILIFGNWAFGFSAEVQEIEVYVNVPRFTPKGESLYLTGSTPELCHWKPDCIKMVPYAENIYYAKIKHYREWEILELKVTRGSYAKQASDGDGKAWGNLSYEFPLDPTPVVISVENWTDFGPFSVQGQVDQYSNFYSPELKNRRTIHVWTPHDYRKNQAERFQVLYMQDGQNVFYSSTSTFGVPWGVDGAIHSLLGEGAIDRTIVVAVDCTNNRTQEYDFARLGSQYADFLTYTVKPFVDSNYRTLADRSHTFVMGSSMGAIISLELLWARPEIFSAAAGLSLPAFFENEKMFRFFQETPRPHVPIKIYFDHGDYGDDQDYEPSVKKFHETLTRLGLDPKQMLYKKFPFADHDEAAWARRVAIPLKFMLKN